MRRVRFNQTRALILVIVCVSGCATLTTETDGLDAEARQQRIAKVTSWDLRGRISVDTGEDAFQGRFTWRQNEDQMRLSIRGPLGAGAVEIRGNEDELFVRSRGETWQMQDPELELSSLLGWWMPVSSLRYWLLGTADGRFTQISTIDEHGLLKSLEQRAWKLDYTRYALAGDVLIPRTLELSHAPLELAVTIDDWRTLEDDP